ncbi:hypothetical protein [Paenibacillus sp. Y412MC10]|uniref:hypothetical protein n=1 Tax=Geobacillus sp. (strain Y412MC10) TaxID=481743 RepID=UPI0011A39A24|nr:hypothetical protein [Paenibacillus sp. Y412MC10]
MNKQTITDSKGNVLNLHDKFQREGKGNVYVITLIKPGFACYQHIGGNHIQGSIPRRLFETSCVMVPVNKNTTTLEAK